MSDNHYLNNFFRHVCQTSHQPIGLIVERAEGSTIHTTDGRQWLDFMSGICVCNIGHAHPEVVSAVQNQAERYLHTMVYGEYVLDVQVELAEKLAQILPDPLSIVYFTNSGTEANEGALKTAKKFSGRQKLIAFENSFHGDTHGSLSVTGRDVYQRPFLPLLPNVEFLCFNEVSTLDKIDAATAAVIVEPIQGEGGVRIPDDNFLPALRQRCNEVGALLIFDEVQTGFGRTGVMFACEHWNVTPDIVTLAKGMGGGMPIGAFVGRPDVMGSLSVDPPLSHVTTFGGHPVSCAAALANLNVLKRDNLPQRAYELGQRIKQHLTNLQEHHPRITDIRGHGLMLGLELETAEITRNFVEAAFERDLILGWTLHSNRVVRLAPPLVLTDEELKRGLDTIEVALESTTGA